MQNGNSKKELDYSWFINDVSQRRQEVILRYLAKVNLYASPDVVRLGGGVPDPINFPITESQFTLRDGTVIKIEGEEMALGLQYLPTVGYKPLLKHCQKIISQLHRPPLGDFSRVIVTAGCQDPLCKVLEMTHIPGTPIVLGFPVYQGITAVVNPLEDSKYITVEQDEYGIIPKKLEEELQRWKQTGGAPPRVMYVNPTGCNPSGQLYTTQRKKEIYAIACKWNLLILEDDPYYFLTFGYKLPDSFLSLDTKGLVVRFDSFSKVLSPGLRLGFACGPTPIMDKLEFHIQVSTMFASSLSQVLVSSMLDAWGMEGFLNNAKVVRQNYLERRNIMLAAADKHLKGLAEWTIPQAGMFLWLKIVGLHDTTDMIMKRGIKKLVSLAPGIAFEVDERNPSKYVRASFSLLTEEMADKGFARLANLIREELELVENQSDKPKKMSRAGLYESEFLDT